MDSVQMPTHWDVRREKAIANTLVTEEAAEEAFGKFELEHVKDHLDSLTPFQAPDYELPPKEVQDQTEAFKKKVLSSPSLNATGLGVDPRTFPQSVKLQVSTPDGVWDLLNNWACAEARDVSSVAAVAIEAGIRALKADGRIPKVALDAYEKQCHRRLARAEARAAIADYLADCNSPF